MCYIPKNLGLSSWIPTAVHTFRVRFAGSGLFGKQAPARLCVVVMANSGPQGHTSKGVQLGKHHAPVSTQTEDQ